MGVAPAAASTLSRETVSYTHLIGVLLLELHGSLHGVAHRQHIVDGSLSLIHIYHGTGVGVGGMIHAGLVVDGVADGHAEGDVGAVQFIILLAHLALAGGCLLYTSSYLLFPMPISALSVSYD